MVAHLVVSGRFQVFPTHIWINDECRHQITVETSKCCAGCKVSCDTLDMGCAFSDKVAPSSFPSICVVEIRVEGSKAARDKSCYWPCYKVRGKLALRGERRIQTAVSAFVGVEVYVMGSPMSAGDCIWLCHELGYDPWAKDSIIVKSRKQGAADKSAGNKFTWSEWNRKIRCSFDCPGRTEGIVPTPEMSPPLLCKKKLSLVTSKETANGRTKVIRKVRNF